MIEMMKFTKRLTIGLVISLVVWGELADAGQNGRIEIRIWDQATVVTPEIRLDQIASISGVPEEVAALKPLLIVSLLNDDQTVTLRAWEIAGRLSEAGFDANRIDVRGSARCIVSYVPEKDGVDTAGHAERSMTSGASVVRRGPASLEAKIREMIERNLTNKGLPVGSKVEIGFSATVQELLALTEPSYRFEIETQQRTTNWIGLVGLKIKVYRNDDLLQTVPVLAQVQVKARIAIAARTINSKARLTSQDLEMTWRAITNLSGKFVTDVTDLADQQARRMIPPGTILTAELFEPLPLVKRGQLVTVLYNRSGLEIKMVGKVMQNGYRDEMVQVRNEQSKEVFRAKVVGAGQVLVENNPTAELFKGAALADGSKR
jgi:flagella basal body P-ring formation protein FlgA